MAFRWISQRSSFFSTRVPASHVIAVGFQVSARFEEMVVKLQIQVVRLEIDCAEHRRRGGGELSERIQNILRLKSYAVLERFAVKLM